MNFLILLTVFSSLWGKFNEIAKVNELKAEGEKAYLAKNYSRAILTYNYLIYQYQNKNESVRLNLAHAYYKNKDTVEASNQYKKLTHSPQAFICSVSNQQLGMIHALQNQNKKALIYFKEALKADPGNESARYNYELTLKKINAAENKNREQHPKEKKDESENKSKGNASENKAEDGENKKTKQSQKNDPAGTIEGENQSSEENPGGEEYGQKNDSEKTGGSGGEENPANEELELNKKGNKQREALISRRLKKMNMTEEKARMILEAMKNAETQYLQQTKKTGKPEYGEDKPDW
jgi:hypothetical protein